MNTKRDCSYMYKVERTNVLDRTVLILHREL